MNSDNIKGLAKKGEGMVESTYGRATGNADTELKGEVNKAAGEAQHALGRAEDKVYDIAGKVRGFIDSASENLSQGTNKVNVEIHENPVRSTLIALGVGFIIGALFTR